MITGDVRSVQGVRASCAARVHRDDAKFLAELLENRLKDLQAVDDRVHEEQRFATGAVLVECEAGAVTMSEPGPMKLVDQPVTCRRVRPEVDGRLITPVRLFELTLEAGDVTLQL